MSHAILICDDDPEIRGAMKRTLRGYEVTESGGGLFATNITVVHE